MTPRELAALVLGLVLIVLGWQRPPPDGERTSESAEARPVAVEPSTSPPASLAISPDPVAPQPSSPAPAPSGALLEAPRTPLAQPVALAPDADAPGTDAPGTRPSAPGPPTLEPIPLPAAGLELVARTAAGEPAGGAPLGVYVSGGRAPLVSGRADDAGRLVLTHTTAVAPRYEVGLVAPGAPRVPWDGSAPRLELTLPEVQTVEVRVVRAARAGVEVELGTGAGLAFLPVARAPLEGDGVARFRWVPVGAEARVRVRYDEGLSEAALSGARAELHPPESGP